MRLYHLIRRVYKNIDNISMKKTILIIYPYPNHRNLVGLFSSKLIEQGIIADAICISDYNVINHSMKDWGCISNYVLSQCTKQTLVGKVFRRIFSQCLIYNILRQYDLIDFHAFVDFDIKLARYCKKKGIQYDITLWGSDLMRADENRIKRMEKGFDYSRCIKSSHNLHDALVAKYGCQYDNKHRIVYFGNNDYDEIDALSNECARMMLPKLYGNTSEKKIVVCGYNGTKFQNHKLMIQAFHNLSDKYASTIHLVFPMTYGANNDYIEEIKGLLETSEFSFSIIDKYLSARELAAIRKTADLVVNIQDTDAFSASLQDHLYCNEVLLIGEWLQYTLLEKDKVFYLKTSLLELEKNIDDALSNLLYYSKQCEGNHEKMKNMTSWDSVINKWVSAYGK